MPACAPWPPCRRNRAQRRTRGCLTEMPLAPRRNLPEELSSFIGPALGDRGAARRAAPHTAPDLDGAGRYRQDAPGPQIPGAAPARGGRLPGVHLLDLLQ
jgi:hypothetical protein